MRTPFLLLVLLAPPALAQTAGLDAVTEAAVELAPGDLDAVLDAVGDARVVLLGEAWHGDGGAIALRAEIVEALHEQLGFNVLAFESDFFGVQRGWARVREGEPVSAVRDDVYGFWTETAAAAPLWDYVAEQAARGDTLHIAGVDSQILSERSRLELPGWLREHLSTLDGADPAEVGAAVDAVAAALGTPGAMPEAAHAEAFAVLRRLLFRLEHEAKDPFVAQTAESLRRNVQGENRDIAMGLNTVWVATEGYPGEKVIVWAHNNHVLMSKWAFWDGPMGAEARAQPGFSPAELAGTGYLGDHVRWAFGRDAVSIATVPYEGTYSPDIAPVLRRQPADFDSTAVLAPAPTGTVEAALANAGHDRAFVDLRPLRSRRDVLPSRVFGYHSGSAPARVLLAEGWDGLLFLRRTHGLNESAPD